MPGKRFGIEPGDACEHCRLMVWFDDIPKEWNQKKRHDFMMEEGEQMLTSVGTSFVLHSKGPYNAEDITEMGEVRFWEIIEDILIKEGYDVYNSDTRFLVWDPGVVTAKSANMTEEEFNECIEEE